MLIIQFHSMEQMLKCLSCYTDEKAQILFPEYGKIAFYKNL